MPVRIVIYLALLGLAGYAGEDETRNATQYIEPLTSPAGPASAQPHLAVAVDGTTILSWLEHGDASVLKYAQLGPDGWSDAKTVDSGDNWFVNWADFPSVQPLGAGRLAAHWLQKSADSTYAYDVRMRLSGDGGKTWTKAFSPHNDGTPTEHGFVSLFADGDDVAAIWLDGRHMTDGEHADGQHAGEGGMTLRYARMTLDGDVIDEHELDSLVCDCCQTDAITFDGDILAVYRNRTENEVRDTYAIRRVDGEWTDGVPVATENWTINGCPVNGPASASFAEHTAVAWFTGAQQTAAVKFATSDNFGVSFSAPVTVDAERPLGRVSIVQLPGGDTVVGWLQNTGGDVRFVVRHYNVGEPVGATITIAEVPAARRAGFPQMVLADDTLVFAWTQFSGEDYVVSTARLKVHQP